MGIGDEIKKARRAKGWKQSDLAEKLNISTQAVSQWETGKTRPSYDLLQALNGLFLFVNNNSFLKSMDVSYEKNALSILDRQAPVVFLEDVAEWASLTSEDIDEFGTWLTPYNNFKGSKFCICIENGRMDPILQKNDIAIFGAKIPPNPGDIVIASTLNSIKPEIGRLSITSFDKNGEAVAALVPESPVYPTLDICGGLRGVHGVAFELRRYLSGGHPMPSRRVSAPDEMKDDHRDLD